MECDDLHKCIRGQKVTGKKVKKGREKTGKEREERMGTEAAN